MESLTVLPWNISLLIFLKQALLLVAMISTVTGVSLFCIFFFFFLFLFFIFFICLSFKIQTHLLFSLSFMISPYLSSYLFLTGIDCSRTKDRWYCSAACWETFPHKGNRVQLLSSLPIKKSKLCSASLSNLRLRIKWIKFIEKTLYSNHGHSL